MRDAPRRQWTAALTTTNTLTPTTRLALLAIANKFMNSEGQLVRGVEGMAGTDDKSKQRRYARYLQAAYEHCWLRQTSAGYLRHAATYKATIPDPGERQVRRPKKGSMTDKECQSCDGVMTDATKQSSMTDNLMSVQERTQSEHREHHAVNEHAPGDDTTNSLATTQVRAYAKATALQREAHQRLTRGEYQGGPVEWSGDILDLVSDDYQPRST